MSDLHFKNGHSSLDRLKVLAEDIHQNTIKGQTYLAFTGDLVDRGDDDLFPNLYEHFLAKLTDHFLGIYTSPGNHDIQRNRTSEEVVIKFLENSEQTYLFDNNSNLILNSPFEKNPFENYFNLQDAICDFDQTNFYYSKKSVGPIRFVSLNSSWLCAKRANKVSDEGKLRIHPAVMDVANKDWVSTDFNICLTHHPLNWLNIEQRGDVARKISDHFDLHLFGHEHTPSATLQGFHNGGCLTLQSPAALSKYGHGSNAYSIIDIEPKQKKIRIKYRTHSEPRGQFIDGNDIVEGGTFYPTNEDRSFWETYEKKRPTNLKIEFKDEFTEFDPQVWRGNSFKTKTRFEVELVEPFVSEFSFSGLSGTDTTGSKRKIPLFQSFRQAKQRLVVIGETDSGLSTSAFLLARYVMVNFDDYNIIPVYIDIANCSSINRASILHEAHRSCPINIPHKRIEELAVEGQLLPIFDNISLTNTEKFNQLIGTLEKYFPKSRVAFFAYKDAMIGNDGLGSSLELSDEKDSMFSLDQLSIQQIRRLVVNWKADAPERQIQKLTETVVSSFKQMDEPIFPSTAVLLLETLQRIPEFRPLSRVALLDRYVECILGRFDLADVSVGAFNSNQKILFLSFIASSMARNDQRALTDLEWSQLVSDYNAKKLLETPRVLRAEFIEKGILLETSMGVTFRADYLFSYFVAKQMSVEQEAFTFFTDNDNFYKFHKEITYFGELEGTDTATLLEATEGRLQALESLIQDAYTKVGLDFNTEWDAMIGDNKGSPEKVSSQVEDLLETVPTAESIERAQGRQLGSTRRARGVGERSTIRQFEHRWLVALGTYLDLLKFSVNLNADTKLHHIKKSLESCELFTKSLAAKRSVIASERYALISGILYINNLAVIDPQKAIDNFKIYAPESVANFFSERTSNEQLLPAFLACVDDATEIGGFLLRALFLELPSTSSSSVFVDSWQKCETNALKTASLNHLKKSYLARSVSKEKEKLYKSMIDRIAVDNANLLPKKTLEKRRLLATIQENINKPDRKS